jgi:hypothetical protein
MSNMNNENIKVYNVTKETFGFESITREGFSMLLANGVSVSVIYGDGSFSDKGETTAEVAVTDSKGNWYILADDKLVVFPLGSEVNPNVTPDELVTILDLAKQI